MRPNTARGANAESALGSGIVTGSTLALIRTAAQLLGARRGVPADDL